MPRQSKDLTRSQLLGMVATLRGVVYSLVHGHPQDVEDGRISAQAALDDTVGDASPEDLVDGGYDMSWSTTDGG